MKDPNPIRNESVRFLILSTEEEKRSRKRKRRKRKRRRRRREEHNCVCKEPNYAILSCAAVVLILCRSSSIVPDRSMRKYMSTFIDLGG